MLHHIFKKPIPFTTTTIDDGGFWRRGFHLRNPKNLQLATLKIQITHHLLAFIGIHKEGGTSQFQDEQNIKTTRQRKMTTPFFDKITIAVKERLGSAETTAIGGGVPQQRLPAMVVGVERRGYKVVVGFSSTVVKQEGEDGGGGGDVPTVPGDFLVAQLYDRRKAIGGAESVGVVRVLGFITRQ
ncbi:unnamed protein product [Lactuca saligna]|uniref:Uncharacterized protein n=1 Tax=Lactuca saligna TaxID=75948 RepID=A0AA35V7J0_LACSI|nr:unnamed protein product [Lactuca saligna]